jgi:anti-sigma regulatory factor (Ser/Thr protein kinase)
MHAEAVFPADVASAAAARRFAASVLRSWGCDAHVDAAQLLVSELVVNSVLHAGSPVTVRLVLGPRALHVEVADTSASVPQVQPVDPERVTGRGMLIVDALASSWGVRPDGTGKVVWFDLAVDHVDPAPVDSGH